MRVFLEKKKLITAQFPGLVELFLKAIKDYRMVTKGDRILVAVSGGKDSLTALCLWDYIQKSKLLDFDMLACNVELGYGCANREVLAEYFTAHDDSTDESTASETKDLGFPGTTAYLRLTYNAATGEIKSWISNNGLAWRGISSKTDFSANTAEVVGVCFRDNITDPGTLTTFFSFFRHEGGSADGARSLNGRFIRIEEALESDTSGQ